MSSSDLKRTIQQQRKVLKDLLGLSLLRLADDLPPLMSSHSNLNERLMQSCKDLPYCKNLFALDANGIQVSSTLNKERPDDKAIGRDRAKRPYMKNMFDEIDFQLSDAYISKNKKRPSMTAIQVIRDENNHRVGFLGVDYDSAFNIPLDYIALEQSNSITPIKYTTVNITIQTISTKCQ